MTPEEFKELSRGDIIHSHNGQAYMVLDTYQGHVSVIPALCDEDADMWTMVVKGAQPLTNNEPSDVTDKALQQEREQREKDHEERHQRVSREGERSRRGHE